MTPEDILAQCLSDLERGRTPAECAARYPEVPDLEAQLRVALELGRGRRFNLRPEAGRRIEAQMRQNLRRWPSAQPNRLPGAVVRWLAPMLAAMALAVSSAGVVAASANSLPGDLLYGVKRATERVQLALTPPSGQAGLHVELAGRRLDELETLAERRMFDPNLADDLTAESEAALAAVEAAPAEQRAALLDSLVRLTGRERTVLQGVIASAPAQAQASLERALAAAQSQYALALSRSGQGDLAEAPAPGALMVKVVAPQDNVVVDMPQVEIRGASTPNAVITLNNEITIADAIGAFSSLVPLVDGPNVIEVLASDAVGNEASLQLVVTYDSGN